AALAPTAGCPDPAAGGGEGVGQELAPLAQVQGLLDGGFAGSRVPEPDFLTRDGQERRAVGAEGGGGDAPRKTERPGSEPTGGGVPEAGGPVAAGRQDEAPV